MILHLLGRHGMEIKPLLPSRAKPTGASPPHIMIPMDCWGRTIIQASKRESPAAWPLMLSRHRLAPIPQRLTPPRRQITKDRLLILARHKGHLRDPQAIKHLRNNIRPLKRDSIR